MQTETTEYRMCSGIRCAEYHELRRTGACCGRHTEDVPVGVVFTSGKTTKPTITDAMVDAARIALVGFDERDWPSRIRDALAAALAAQEK